MSVLQEWAAWNIVRERERDMEQRRKIREAERARQEEARPRPTRPVTILRRPVAFGTRRRGRRAA